MRYIVCYIFINVFFFIFSSTQVFSYSWKLQQSLYKNILSIKAIEEEQILFVNKKNIFLWDIKVIK